MLKHCQATANDHTRRSRRRLGDNTSLNSSGSASFNSSFGSDSLPPEHSYSDSRRSSFSSPEPISLISRTSSFASLSLESAGGGPRTPIKIFAKCLRSDIEYKTLSVGFHTNCKELVWLLLAKYKMKNRDPNLFYLTMDINIKRTGIPLQRTITLDDEARPAELKSCHPWGECKFTLQMRKGGLVRIHDSILMAESKYKCLLIAEHTTVAEVIRILFHCYNLERIEQVERFCLVEQCQSQSYERLLHPQDRPAQVQSLWPSPTQFMFVLKRSQPGNAGLTVKSNLPHPATIASHCHQRFPLDTDRREQSPSSSSNVATAAVVVNNNNMTSNSAGVSPVGSDTSSTTSTSPSLNGSAYSTPRLLIRNRFANPMGPSGSASLILPPKMNLASIHESGLPSPPIIRPKPTPASVGLLFSGSRASLGSLSSGSRSSNASYHDYENYFYI
ncbi:hypothetical protein TCAL_05504 [Tigriopus californicus]|uniref:Ras-associating domain-containing protein n=1 Tax=Tigriopus californicus TaxID=6832 RepID=A0A553NPT3_TIGCA|nr:uncharacterized protein LOC131879529 [Tigriopus californicus]TRY67443.1 hypothetical protein TCAL_05504 [Tigriopus californicus]|eukprot:TCALIF_05504-PA protein Name:"Protein of unknown function" AED:0.21 eAED:0.21 QI:0/-1/0/1/-1/1/1/0/444